MMLVLKNKVKLIISFICIFYEVFLKITSINEEIK